MCKSLELGAREVLRFCKQNLMEHSGRSPEDQSAKRNAVSGGPVHEVSEWDKGSTGNWTGGHSCHILVKGLTSTFCPCPENLSEAEDRQSGLICFSEEMARQLASKLWHSCCYCSCLGFWWQRTGSGAERYKKNQFCDKEVS